MGHKHISKKLRKREKQNVNGAGDVQYVLLEFLTARGLQTLFEQKQKFELVPCNRPNPAVDKWTQTKKQKKIC